MARSASAGSKFFIGTTVGLDTVETDWAEVGLVTNLGEFGTSYAVISAETLGDQKVFKAKGINQLGSMTVSVLRDTSDVGQARARLAANNATSIPYNCKIELNDAPTGPSPTPTTFTFKALLNSYTTNISGSGDFVSATVQVEITDDITETAAAPGI